jgi:formamidopyrimidine-DNA glycosylase
MPELPEVETIVRDLREAGVPGCTVRAVRVRWPRIVTVPSVSQFSRTLKGLRIVSIDRRAKYIVMTMSKGFVLTVHLRMTGQFRYLLPQTLRDPHEHIVLGLDSGRELRYRDTRKFGRWTLTQGMPEFLIKLGPEPLSSSFTLAEFRRRLSGHRRQLKPLLLDQHFIAGIGNIYADEALFAARIHPLRPSASLSATEQAVLHRAIRRVLRQGIRRMGTTLGTGAANFYSVSGRRGRNSDNLKVFRRTGQPCPVCAAPIEHLVVGQRSSHICPQCQV